LRSATPGAGIYTCPLLFLIVETTSAIKITSSAPEMSISTSYGDDVRLGSNDWFTSSAMAIIAASPKAMTYFHRSSGGSAEKDLSAKIVRTAYSVTWAHLRMKK